MTGIGLLRQNRWLLGAQVGLATASVLLCFAGLAAATPQEASSGAQASEATTYLDPTGDAVDGELDISVVSFDLDRSSGRITLSFTVSGFDPASWDGRPRNVQVHVSSRGTQLALMVEGGPQDVQAWIGHPGATSWPTCTCSLPTWVCPYLRVQGPACKISTQPRLVCGGSEPGKSQARP